MVIDDFEYDRNAACRHIGVDKMNFDMLLDNFSLSYLKDLEKIEHAIHEENLDEIRKSSHYLKSSAANLQMNSLANVLKKVEINAKNGIISQVNFVSIKEYIESVLD